jgi:hypothetical protein
MAETDINNLSYEVIKHCKGEKLMRNMFKLLFISITVTFFCLEAEATDYTITILADEVTQDDLHVLGELLNTVESSEKVHQLLRRVALSAVEETNKNLSARIDDLGFLKLDDDTSIQLYDGDSITVKGGMNDCGGKPRIQYKWNGAPTLNTTQYTPTAIFLTKMNDFGRCENFRTILLIRPEHANRCSTYSPMRK